MREEENVYFEFMFSISVELRRKNYLAKDKFDQASFWSIWEAIKVAITHPSIPYVYLVLRCFCFAHILLLLLNRSCVFTLFREKNPWMLRELQGFVSDYFTWVRKKVRKVSLFTKCVRCLLLSVFRHIVWHSNNTMSIYRSEYCYIT